MARLLPKRIVTDWRYLCDDNDTEEKVDVFKWKDSRIEVLETEWLYVVHLVEQTLKKAPYNINKPTWQQYLNQLSYETTGNYCLFDMVSLWIPNELLLGPALSGCADATFNQRATAMCKVKGITL